MNRIHAAPRRRQQIAIYFTKKKKMCALLSLSHIVLVFLRSLYLLLRILIRLRRNVIHIKKKTKNILLTMTTTTSHTRTHIQKLLPFTSPRSRITSMFFFLFILHLCVFFLFCFYLHNRICCLLTIRGPFSGYSTRLHITDYTTVMQKTKLMRLFCL